MQPPLQPRFLVQYNMVFTTMWLQLNHVLEKQPLIGPFADDRAFSYLCLDTRYRVNDLAVIDLTVND